MSSSIPGVSLGGDAKHIRIAQIAFGTMHFTWKAAPETSGDILQVIKAAVEAASPHKLLLNGGAFYGPPNDAWANLRLIKNFFAEYPQLREKVVLSIKGGFVMEEYVAKGFAGIRTDAKEDNVRRDLIKIKEELGGDVPDIYELARVDPHVSIEDQMKNLSKLKGEGLFKYIGVSEMGADSLRRAAKVAPVASIEDEYSLWETAVEDNGVLKAVEELEIPLIAYSPTGKGMLSGQLKSRADLPEGDIRLHQDRFSEENFAGNVKLGEALAEYGSKHNPPATAAQQSLSWLIAQSPQKRLIVPLPATSKLQRIKENFDSAKPEFELDAQQSKEIRKLLADIGVKGERYNAHMRATNLWG
ncbi:Aldo/keto reductase [Ceraceosorus guamensis]|uniref:Aldo/keto reductase n=1 Tax=Ceraceosorus guamensis TaxID=1522189 RepID=A0A316VS48_9BASI|nr:Aldo/keto reductase [Ceraceosorus guamensis]PWN39233.1 Aldo/keto reductase [Ceraceosorus guamensis]